MNVAEQGGKTILESPRLTKKASLVPKEAFVCLVSNCPKQQQIFNTRCIYQRI